MFKPFLHLNLYYFPTVPKLCWSRCLCLFETNERMSRWILRHRSECIQTYVCLFQNDIDTVISIIANPTLFWSIFKVHNTFECNESQNEQKTSFGVISIFEPITIAFALQKANDSFRQFRKSFWLFQKRTKFL